MNTMKNTEILLRNEESAVYVRQHGKSEKFTTWFVKDEPMFRMIYADKNWAEVETILRNRGWWQALPACA